MKTNVDNPTSPLASEVRTQTDVTVSRALGSTYHNTTNKPLFCVVTINYPNGAEVDIKSDSNAAPVLLIGYVTNGAVTIIVQTTTFIVLPGNYYKTVVANGSPSLQVWIEYT